MEGNELKLKSFFQEGERTELGEVTRGEAEGRPMKLTSGMWRALYPHRCPMVLNHER